MNLEFLDSLNINELEKLADVLKNDKSNGKFLKNVLNLINERKIEIDKIRKDAKDFSSSNILYYDENNEEKCLEILENMDLSQFFFFCRSFVESGNKGPKLRDLGFKNFFEVEYLAVCFNVVPSKIALLGYTENFLDRMPLVNMEKFFELESIKSCYENSYNIYNYIKSYIYQCLMYNKDIDAKDIFSDYSEKKFIVASKLKEMASYLYEVRGNDGARCSVANGGLSRTANKKGDQITFGQKRLVEALAFGTTKEKIINGDYSDTKKLIYLPR